VLCKIARYRYRDTAGCQEYGEIQAGYTWNRGGVFQKYTPGEGYSSLSAVGDHCAARV